MKRANGRGTLYRRGNQGVWYVKIVIGGKLVRKSTGETDREKAEAVLNEYAVGADLPTDARLAAFQQIIDAAKAPSPTIGEAWALYVKHPRNVKQTSGAQGVDHGRWDVFVRWLHGYDGGPRCRVNCKAAHAEVKTLAQVTPAIAAEFHAFAEGTASPSTVNRYVRVLKRVWAFAGVRENPWDDFSALPVEATKRRRLSKEEIQRLVNGTTGEPRTLILIAVYTALRLQDAARITWDRIDMKRKIIRLRPHKTIHTSGVWVELPIHPTLYAVLVAIGPKADGPVMPDLASWPEWKLSNMAQGIFEACGMAESVKRDGYQRRTAIVGFHCFRVTFISEMADQGVPLALVRALVGHIDEELTQLYYRAETERARMEIVKLPSFTA